jgi:hypothetical protein
LCFNCIRAAWGLSCLQGDTLSQAGSAAFCFSTVSLLLCGVRSSVPLSTVPLFHCCSLPLCGTNLSVCSACVGSLLLSACEVAWVVLVEPCHKETSQDTWQSKQQVWSVFLGITPMVECGFQAPVCSCHVLICLWLIFAQCACAYILCASAKWAHAMHAMHAMHRAWHPITPIRSIRQGLGQYYRST